MVAQATAGLGTLDTIVVVGVPSVENTVVFFVIVCVVVTSSAGSLF